MSLIKLNRENFERHQKAKGWSDKELAQRMGIHRVQIWRVKEGHNEPGRDFIAGSLKVFSEASFEELFFMSEVLRAR